MFIAHTIGVIIRHEPDRLVVVEALRSLGHSVVAAETWSAGQLQQDGWSEMGLLVVDEENADASLSIDPHHEREVRGVHLPALIVLHPDSDFDPWLERGFDDLVHLPVVPTVLQARVRTLLRLRAAAEQRFQSLFEHASVGVFRLSSGGHLMVANPAFVRMLGYDTIHQVRSSSPAHLRISRPPLEPTVREDVWVRRDGRALPVLVRTHPVFSASGELLWFEGLAEDLSQHKLIEEALRDHAARLTLALDAAGMADFVYDIQKDEMEGHLLVARLLGYEDEPGRFGSESVLRRVHPDDVSELRRSLRYAIVRDSTWQHEFKVVWPDGTVHWLAARGEVFRDAQRRPERLIGVVRDATADKKLRLDLIAAKQEAERMADLKSTFLANMSHEIRTPLTAIIGFASLLSGRVPEEHLQSVTRIQQGGQRLLDTLNAVLTLARLESGQMMLELEPVDVKAEAQAALRMFAQQAREKDIRLAFSSNVPDASVRATLDRGALASILQNLIGNGIKFTESGEVRVSVRLDRLGGRRYVWIRVRDTGRGIDDSFLPHIFDEFRQESSGLRRQHEGAGLGLAIVRRLTQILGGKLRVSSIRGEGSVFAVGFPVAEMASPQKSDEPPDEPPDEAKPRRPRLLVVEDNDDTRELLHDLLQERFDVTLAGTAQEALACARKQRFDVILMDINLGAGQSGEEVAAMLRERPYYRDVPIIALTAYALPGDAERFLEAGFSAHLPKPFNPAILLDLIDSVGR